MYTQKYRNMSKDTKCNNDFFRDFSYGIKVTAVVVHLAVLVVIDRIAEENTRRQKKKEHSPANPTDGANNPCFLLIVYVLLC